jgi:hypothetical protein
MSERLQTPIALAHLCSSNERATNDNTNGVESKNCEFIKISRILLAAASAGSIRSRLRISQFVAELSLIRLT